GSRKYVPAGAVNPGYNVAGVRLQLLPECLRRHLIAPEGLLVYGPFEAEEPAAGLCFDPVTESRQRAALASLFFGVLSLCRFSLSGWSSCGPSGSAGFSSSSGSSAGSFCGVLACPASANFPASLSFT